MSAASVDRQEVMRPEHVHPKTIVNQLVELSHDDEMAAIIVPNAPAPSPQFELATLRISGLNGKSFALHMLAAAQREGTLLPEHRPFPPAKHFLD